MKILTFDVEDWFHILDNDSTKHHHQWQGFEGRLRPNVDRLLDLLGRHGQKATFFCLGWVAEHYPDVVKRISGQGHELGSHSYYHQLVYEQIRKDFKTDLEDSIKVIQDLTGKPVRCYRAPGFSITKSNLWALEMMMESGIEVDCSIFTPKRAHGGVSDFPIQNPFIIELAGIRLKEFPMTFFKLAGLKLVFSGGGYFRLIPYPLIRYMSHKSRYVMTYFHPRDFDPGQPVLSDLSPLRKFKSYHGLKSAFDKLEHLIRDFRFLDLREAERSTDWEKVEVVKL